MSAICCHICHLLICSYVIAHACHTTLPQVWHYQCLMYKMWGCVCVLMLCEWCVVVSGGRGALTAVECITSGCHCTGRCTATSHRHHPEEELLSSRRRSRHFEPRTPAHRAALLQPVCSIWVKACRVECSGTLQLVISFLLFQNASKDFGVPESFEQSQDWRGEQEEGLQDWG